MIAYVSAETVLSALHGVESGSLDFVVLMTGTDQPAQWLPCVEAAGNALRPGGMLFIQGIPEHLPELGVYADGFLTFKYWIAIESAPRPDKRLISTHAGLLLFVKGQHFQIGRVRFPHRHCRACGRPLRDWGGKSHLMHPEGTALSDVWKDLPPADNYSGLSRPALEIALRLASPTGRLADAEHLRGIVGPAERLTAPPAGNSQVAEPAMEYCLPLVTLPPDNGHATGPDCALPLDSVIQGDALEVLARLPENSVDLVFADPPYNLDKAYTTYDDERDRHTYLSWCNAWLDQYARILKPGGSLYVLNLPRWAMYHAAHLNRRLYFQNWIVWDALSEPRGKLMPAHYALLFYTKHPTDFTFSPQAVSPIDARDYCLRPTCVRQRKARGDDAKEALTDIWRDIHRIKHRRDRDYHPCQLPNALMERIILLSTRPGDVVVDAMAGAGTTAVVAAQLGRHYIAIDLDADYVAITREKLAQVKLRGHIQRSPVARPRPRYSKKALQLELRDIALRLGHLPAPEEVEQMSRYGLQPFLDAFPTWGKALKAARQNPA